MPLPSNRKLSDEQRIEICERWKAGEQVKELAEEYGVSTKTIDRVLRRNNVTSPATNVRTAQRELQEFTKRVRSILWRSDPTRVKYNAWQDRVNSLEAGGMARKEAIVQASKDFPELTKLFREYNVSDYDPHEGSHPKVEHHGTPKARKGIPYTGEKLTQLDSLRWAAQAAGHFLNTGVPPERAPNAECYLYYRMAQDEPKEFLSRIIQLFARYDESSAEEKRMKKRSKMAIDEIMENLRVLEEEENE